MEPVSLTALTFSSLFALTTPTIPPLDDQSQNYLLPAIAGLWQIELNNAGIDHGSCAERYNFRPNGVMNTTSNQEYTMGEYAFYYIEESELPVLAIKTLHDNNQPDCSGAQVDQTGESFAAFVKLDDKHNPRLMQWCHDLAGTNCPSRFRRLLP